MQRCLYIVHIHNIINMLLWVSYVEVYTYIILIHMLLWVYVEAYCISCTYICCYECVGIYLRIERICVNMNVCKKGCVHGVCVIYMRLQLQHPSNLIYPLITLVLVHGITICFWSLCIAVLGSHSIKKTPWLLQWFAITAFVCIQALVMLPSVPYKLPVVCDTWWVVLFIITTGLCSLSYPLLLLFLCVPLAFNFSPKAPISLAHMDFVLC